jgi:hypothetical protein
MANAAFYYGLVRSMSQDDRPVWTKMSFAAAEQNFTECARRGIDSRVYWPGFGEVGVDELVLRHLLPMAHEGLADWGVASTVMDRYLSVIEGRARTGVNGATWQTDTVRVFEEHGMDRASALRRMLEHYVENLHTNEPVHTWKIPVVTHSTS